jgi:signal transduction histidine kinase
MNTDPPSGAPRPKIRVLYAEDNPLDADLTQSRLADEAPEFVLETVGTGAGCLERLEGEKFDVLLLDNHLPDMDGTEVLGRLLAQGSVLPVVMVTGAGDEEFVARALRAGASDYLPKSGDYLGRLPAVLRTVVAEHRDRAGSGRAIAAASRSILYVEPGAMDAELTARHFASAAPHLKLTVVRSAAEALARLSAPDAFDLVLADLRMPGMNALELLHEAKHRGIQTPFIIITGRGDEETAVAILRLGAYDYIVKRENYLTQLAYAIDNAISRFHLARASERMRLELVDLTDSLERKVRERTALLEREIGERRQIEEKNAQLLAVAERSRRALLGITEDQKRASDALREQMHRVRELSQRLIALQEDERRAISRELHDGIGQNLSALSLNVSILGSQLAADSAGPAAARLEDTRKLLEATIQQARDVMAELRPQALDALGLVAALAHHARQIARRSGVAIEVEGVEPSPRLEPAAEIGLFRIAQEALNNIIKHAQARHVGVSLSTEAGAVRLAIADDGAGFDAATVRAARVGSLGLAIMRERADALGARLAIDSVPGKGTRVVVELSRVA